MTAPALALAAATAGGWLSLSSRSQVLGPFPYRGPDAGGRRVALTFDDGPNEPYTSRLVALLAARDVRATFFQVGRAVAQFPDVTRALLSAGHVVGNHSYTHEFHRCFGSRSVDDEMWRAQDVFGEHAGITPRLYRPPWLARTPATFRALRRHGLMPVSGTFCHPLEVARCGPARIATRAVARTEPGTMLIFHDGYNGRGADRSRTLDAVARTIDTLGAAGWTFTTVDDLLGVAAYRA